LKSKLHPYWANAFPQSAARELKQGRVVLEVTLDPNGSARVAWPPQRTSGIEEFDRNCAEAVRRASPFEPLPSTFASGPIRVRIAFDAQMPIVQ